MTRDSRRGPVALVRIFACALLLASAPALAAEEKIDPEADRKALQAFVFAKFPKVAKEDFGNGPDAVNAQMRKQWMEIMEFPPYELALDEGRAEWEKPFANGRRYADCFDNKGVGVDRPTRASSLRQVRSRRWKARSIAAAWRMAKNRSIR